MIELEDRVLLNNGISVVTPEKLAEHILAHGEVPDHIRCIPCKDTEAYQEVYGVNLGQDLKDDEISPEIVYDRDYYNEVITELFNFNRDGIDEQVHKNRLTEEIDFFERTGSQGLIVTLYDLLLQFLEDGVVWSGRGSSCASYLLFIIGVHDTNPITYDIDFNEFSKEK